MNTKQLKRFEVDFYRNDFDRETTFEQIFISDKFMDIVSKATNFAKLKAIKYVEFYYNNLFIGSIDKKNNYKFVKGRYYKKYPLLIH